MKRCMVLGLIALAIAGARAQTGAIPPPSAQAIQQHNGGVWQNGAKDAALALPGAILEGSAISHYRMGLSGATEMFDAARRGSGHLSNTVDAVRLIHAGAKGGWSGMATEGVQLGMEKGVEMAITGAATRAAGSALGGYGAGAIGMAWTGGSIVGGVVRDYKWSGDGWMADAVGQGRSIGDVVDDKWFEVAPNRLKEAVSGVRQIDFDSPEHQREMQSDIDRRRRHMAFDRVQRENAEQASQQLRHQQQQAADAAGAATAAPSNEPDSTGLFLNQLNQSLMQMQLQAQQRRLQTPMPMSRTAPVTPAMTPPVSVAPAPAACQIDPKTGCHPGHDEKSHPGGCKCGR